MATEAHAAPAVPTRWYRSLYVQVLIAIAIGVLLGHYFPEKAAKLQPLGEAFVNLIKMMIAPIIFCTVVTGIAGMESMKAVGKTGALAILYFEVVTTLALVIGLLIVNVVQPGAGMNIDPAQLDPAAAAKYAASAEQQHVVGFLMNLIPKTIVGAFAAGDILQVLLVSVLFGFALHALGASGRPIFDFVDRLGAVMFRIVGMIMRLAPIGAFGAMAFTIGAYGIGSLVSLGKLMACFYATCLLFIFVVLGAIAKLHGFSIARFIRYIREELFIVLGTSSSESVLPRMIGKLQQAGAEKQVVGLVIPAGYSFNLDGTCIYLTMATVFLAQALNVPLSLVDQLKLVAVLLLTSKGAAGVTGSGLIVLAGTLAALHSLPVAAVALIVGIDRFMSEARALTNLVGNGVATLVVAKWCGALDENRLREELGRGS
jgi:aerobic C4-dicarboxylate transport protein